MDSKLRVSSKKVLVLSYEYDSIVKENLKNLDNFSNVLKDKIGIDKKVAIVSDEEWEKEKTKYIEKMKNNDKYTYVDEPELVYNSIDTSSDTIDDDSIGVFGDIVEIEQLRGEFYYEYASYVKTSSKYAKRDVKS